jgi:uncharacterized RDD family membrane protein YckC
LSTSSRLPYEPSRDTVPSWKKEVNERLAAHRTRHAKKENGQTELPVESHEQQAHSRARKAAARVAARYANAPTYSELLAQEARNAARAASAAADAAKEAHAAAQAILQGLDLQPEKPVARQAPPPSQRPSPDLASEPEVVVPVQPPPAPLEPKTVLPPPDFVPRQTAPEAIARPRATAEQAESTVESPESAFVEPAEPIPGNLIEFPRTLIAPQKARPRVAEGPLREKKNDSEAEQSQLSIFEVEAERKAVAEKESSLPTQSLAEWSSIELDAQPPAFPAGGISSSVLDELPLASATLEDRLMAGLVDMCLVSLGFLGFVAAFVACTPRLPSGNIALAAIGITWVAFHLIYQYLFFTFAEGTPGMRYAHIALCTFDDENPTRPQMRKRIPATLLSFAAMGMGFLWALFDEDHLSWHDRLTHTYQRSYR